MASNILSKHIESEKVNMTIYGAIPTVPQTATNRPQSAVKGVYTTVQAMFLLREGERSGL